MIEIIYIGIIVLLSATSYFLHKRRLNRIMRSLASQEKEDVLPKKFWKRAKPFGKWKYILFYGFILKGFIPSTLTVMLKLFYEKYFEHEIVEISKLIVFYVLLLVLLSIYGIKNELEIWRIGNNCKKKSL